VRLYRLAQTTQDEVQGSRAQDKTLQEGQVASLQRFYTEAPKAREGEDILGEAHVQKETFQVWAQERPEVLPTLTQQRPLGVEFRGPGVPDA